MAAALVLLVDLVHHGVHSRHEIAGGATVADLKVREVDDLVWRRARAFALVEGLTMGQMVTQALESYMARPAGAPGHKHPIKPSYLPPGRRPLGATSTLSEGAPAGLDRVQAGHWEDDNTFVEGDTNGASPGPFGGSDGSQVPSKSNHIPQPKRKKRGRK